MARVSLPATATAVAAAQQLTGAGHTRLRRWIDTLAPALVYLAIRQIGLLVLVCMSSATGSSTTAELTSWDGQRFLGIAGGGYDGVPAEMIDRFGRHDPDTSLAFFPGYPRAGGGGGWVARRGRHCGGAGRFRRLRHRVRLRAGTARRARSRWLAPRGVGAGRAGGRRSDGRGVLDGLLRGAVLRARGVGAGRSPAAAVGARRCLLRRGRAGAPHRGGADRGGRAGRPGGDHTAAGLVAAMGGRDARSARLVAYLGFVALRTGQWDGWFTLQRRGWGLAFDGGPSTLRFTREVLVTAPSVLEVVTVAVLAVLRRARCHRHGEQLVRRLLAHRLAVRDLASRAPRPGSEVDLVRLPLPAHCRVSAPHSLTSIISTSTSAGPILLPTGTSRAYTSQLDSKGQIPGTCVSQTLTPSSSTGSRSLDPRTPAKSSDTTPVMRWR